MQPLRWYFRRLRSMSAAEITWRIRELAQGITDPLRLVVGWYPQEQIIEAVPRLVNDPPPFRVTDMIPGEWVSPNIGETERLWRDNLMEAAEQILRHRFSFFELRNHPMGDPIDWNRDHASGKAAPMRYSQVIDYRDFRVTGDCKLVWEPNRHHQLVVLARAYRATGEQRYAVAAVEQLDSWLQQNPFGKGMNWRSPLELGIRLINWVWALDLIRETGLPFGDLRHRIVYILYLHCWQISRRYSRGSSANNHLVGEAAGMFVATAYFRDLPNADRWRHESRSVLEQEIVRQTYPDGCTREQALGYQFFVLQFYLIAGLTARWTGEDFSPDYWSRLEQMLGFLGMLTDGGAGVPLFGDNDDGYVLDLGAPSRDPRALLAVGAALFHRSDFRSWAKEYSQPSRWLLGRDSREHFDGIRPQPARRPLLSRAFPDSGYYLLQSGNANSSGRISVLFDCGELGYGPLAAHGHADALSFTLRAFGLDVLVDPGTYDYFTFPAWRNYFRSTQAHNTVVVDDTDQSEMLGPFLWGTHARARLVRWEPRRGGGIVAAEHDGYTRLPDPVVHRRTVELDGESRVVTVRDELLSQGRHAAAIYFHVSESCSLKRQTEKCYELVAGEQKIWLELDPALSAETLTGSENPIGGWISHSYHRKTPSTTVIGRGAFSGNSVYVCRIRISAAR